VSARSRATRHSSRLRSRGLEQALRRLLRVRNGAGNIVTTRLAAHVRCSGVVSAGARRPRRALKGNKAQEGQGVLPPATEVQRHGLDCGAKPRRRRSQRKPGETKRWKRRFEQPRWKLRANVREATATVTWCGCRRGRSFEGYESRRGEGDSFGSVCGPHGSRERGGGTGNAMNPRIGSGMQQAREPSGGVNRRGGARPRGRNMRRGWLPRRRSRAERPCGSGLRRPCR
jgi:hypothetical protein